MRLRKCFKICILICSDFIPLHVFVTQKHLGLWTLYSLCTSSNNVRIARGCVCVELLTCQWRESKEHKTTIRHCSRQIRDAFINVRLPRMKSSEGFFAITVCSLSLTLSDFNLVTRRFRSPTCSSDKITDQGTDQAGRPSLFERCNTSNFILSVFLAPPMLDMKALSFYKARLRLCDAKSINNITRFEYWSF